MQVVSFIDAHRGVVVGEGRSGSSPLQCAGGRDTYYAARTRPPSARACVTPS